MGNLRRMRQHVDRLADEVGRRLNRVLQGVCHRAPEHFPEAVAIIRRFRAPLRRPPPANSFARNSVGHRHDDANEGDAIGNAMVKAHDQRMSPECGIHKVKLPQRPLPIERLGSKSGHEFLQLDLASRTRQPGMVQVVVDTELRVILPPVAGCIFDDTLDETPMPQHAYLDCTLQALHIQPSVEQHDPENLHQIVGAIHAQPRCIDG